MPVEAGIDSVKGEAKINKMKKIYLSRPIYLSLVFKISFLTKFLIGMSSVYAAIVIPFDNTVSMPTGATLHEACGNVLVEGNFITQNANITEVNNWTIAPTGQWTAPSTSLTISGDFLNQGKITPNDVSLTISDGCGSTSSTLTGETAFHNLKLETHTGKPFFVGDGTTITVSGLLTLIGTAENPAVLGSIGGGDIVLLPGARLDVNNGEILAPLQRRTAQVPVPIGGGLAYFALVALMLLSMLVFTKTIPKYRHD